jgi:hypothetical protein
MRRTTTCLLLLLCSLAAFGQSKAQWTVIRHMALTGQSAPIPKTTIFVPAEPGFYRLSAYISESSNKGWFLRFNWIDLSGADQTLDVNPTGESVAQIGSYVFVPVTGVPVSYLVEGSASEYNIAFTIEKLKE